MTKYINFYTESATEKYAVLVGRIEALAVYMDSIDMDYVSKDIVRAMLGLEVSENE